MPVRREGAWAGRGRYLCPAGKEREKLERACKSNRRGQERAWVAAILIFLVRANEWGGAPMALVPKCQGRRTLRQHIQDKKGIKEYVVYYTVLVKLSTSKYYYRA